jgi:hypothetical protein
MMKSDSSFPVNFTNKFLSTPANLEGFIAKWILDQRPELAKLVFGGTKEESRTPVK